MILLLWMMACSSESKDSGLDPDTYDGPIDLPVLVVDSPGRGSFTGGGALQYAGQGTRGTWELASLELNGEPVDLSPDGSFSESLDLEPGLIILGTRLEDEGGERAVDARSVYHGSVREPGDWVEEGVRLQLGPELLDDDDPDLDDVASFGELLLDDAGLLDDVIGEPISTENVTVTPTYVYYTDAEIDLEPQSDVLRAEVTVYNPYMEFDLNDIAGYSWLSTSGSTWMDSITVEIGLTPVNQDGEIEVEITTASTSQTGFDLELEWVPGFVEDFLIDWLESQLQEEISTIAQEELPELIAGLLNSLLVEGDLGSGIALGIELADIEVASDGIRVTADGRLSSDTIDFSALPEGAGALITDASAPDWPLSDEPFSIALDDDIANQLFFEMWANGDFGPFSYSGLKVGVLSGGPLPEPLGPAETVTFDIQLPPVLAAPIHDGNTVDMSIGEFRVVIEREDGEVLDFSVNVRTGAELLLDEEQELSVSMDNRPAFMTVEVGTLQGPEGVDPGDLAALIRLVMPTLLGNAGNFLPSLSLPTIPIEDILPQEELEGMVLGLQELDFHFESSNWLVLSSGLTVE